jgi:protein-S-isoprenylcysteine O-methyltransferase Ste14
MNASLTFLIPLFLSFIFNLASTFTAVYSRRLGARPGQLISAVLRNVLGLPLLGLAFVLAARQPAPRLLGESWLLAAAAWVLFILGTGLILWSLLAIRLQAAAPSVSDALVQHGLYAYVRHPLYDGVFLELGGAALARPTWPMLLSCGLAAGWVIVQAWAEEQDLLQRLPGYRAYIQRVPRFVPRFWKG